jgi:c-di-GMP phosphodiesterase
MPERRTHRDTPIFRISLVKDIGTAMLLAAFVVVARTVIVPGVQARQAGALEAQYLEEQRLIIRRTVMNASARVESLGAKLRAEGVERAKAEELILSDLQKERFGVDGYGYFFVVDEARRIILHGTIPELEGRPLDGVLSPDGKSIGALFSAALDGKDSGYVEYSWSRPGDGKPDRKTTFAYRAMGGRWLICAGFFASDLAGPIAKYRSNSAAIIKRYQAYVLVAMVAFAILLAALSYIVDTSIKRAERSLERQMRALEQYKLILDESSMVSRTDPQGKITYVNDAFCETTGHSREEAVGRSHNIERHPDTPLETFRAMWAAITAGKPWHGIIKNRKADGSRYYKKATIVPIMDEEGEIVEYISSGQDVTEIIEGKRNLENAFQTDPLTGLGNRLRLVEDLGRSPAPCVALLDIEGFAGINHGFGTEAGDSVLRQTASRILDFCEGGGARAYRIYADTFAILDSAESPGRFEELKSSLGEMKVDLNGEGLTLATRIGFAANGGDSFAFADAALKRAKRERKRAVALGEGDVEGSDALENLRILRSVHEAIEADRVYPVFQPIARIGTGEIAKYECLMRLDDAQGRQMLPDEFIGVSKKTGGYKRLTMRLIEKSISAFIGQKEQFSVNLTIEDLLDEPTISFIVSEVRQTGIAGRLFVEIVETEELRDFERAGEMLDYLRSEGIGVAVDDFGSGYSSFEYLIRLSPTYVKIDRGIVQSILSDPRAKDLLVSIVLFAKKAGIQTIAEYIDSEELLGEVGRLGVDFAQGWLIGKPARNLLKAVGA